jgi:hypothetical protein
LKSVADHPTVLHFVDDGDAYWTSHLLLDGWLAGLAEQVGGIPVAFAPERGTLVVAAAGSDHLKALFSQVEEVYVGSARAVSPMAYVSDEHGRTVAYRVAKDHPLRSCVDRSEAILALREYAQQAELLPDAAELVLVRGDAGWRSRALWPQNGPALLPRADEILVGQDATPWSALEPHLHLDPDFDPPRWRAEAWPARS